jgi:hypothetical protein
MAKKAKNGNVSDMGDVTDTVTTVADVIITDAATGRTIRFGDLPVKSQSRLVTKGANEILTDSGAFSKEQVAKMTADGTLDAKKAEARDKRWNSLLTGEFSVGVRGPRVDESTRVYNECLTETFKAYWNKSRAEGAKVVPFNEVKAEQLKKLLDRWAAHTGPDGKTMGETARAEADRRIGAKAEITAGFDLTA